MCLCAPSLGRNVNYGELSMRTKASVCILLPSQWTIVFCSAIISTNTSGNRNENMNGLFVFDLQNDIVYTKLSEHITKKLYELAKKQELLSSDTVCHTASINILDTFHRAIVFNFDRMKRRTLIPIS